MIVSTTDSLDEANLRVGGENAVEQVECTSKVIEVWTKQKMLPRA